MKNNKTNTKNSISNVVFIAFCIFLLFMCYFVPNVWISISIVEHTSMNDTLVDGDMLITDKLAKANSGDVIVFKYDENNSYIKRVIAVGGELVFNDVDGNVWVDKKDGNGAQMLVENYVKNDAEHGTRTYKNYFGSDYLFSYEVPEGQLFVLGDNRVVSIDSRDFGCILESQVTGVVHQFLIKSKKVTNFLFSSKQT